MTVRSLLEEIELEAHNEAIERGNLKRKKPVFAPFVPKWTPAGNIARVLVTTCTCCNTPAKTLQGIFSVLSAPTGEKRLIAQNPALFLAEQWQNPQPLEIEESHASAPLCASCVDFLKP